MKARASVYLSVILLVSLMGITAACNQVPNDAQISTQLQDKLNADSGLQGKQLSVQASKGVVTLSGNVDNDAQREAAARYAAAIPGVKEVINNLQVGAPASAAAVQDAPQQQAPASSNDSRSVRLIGSLTPPQNWLVKTTCLHLN